MPSGNIGVRTAPGSAALNLNVGISWETADRLYKQYGNTDGTISTRHQPTKSDAERGPRSNPKYATAVAYATVALQEAEARKQQAADALKASQEALAQAEADVTAAKDEAAKKAAEQSRDALKGRVDMLTADNGRRAGFVTQRQKALDDAQNEAKEHNKELADAQNKEKPPPPPNKPSVPSRTAGPGDPPPPPPLNRPRTTRAP